MSAFHPLHVTGKVAVTTPGGTAESDTDFTYTSVVPGTYYVNIASGNDANDGSDVHPWKTLHHAITQINGGDTGTYTLHVALGTDTVHMHPQVSGEKMGAASMIDFRRLCSAVADLGDGGVWVNIGSAVILPEVFLKAVSVARNLGANLDEMVTANLDMQRHYRVQENVLQRPVKAGNSFNVIGHHEILLPLLRMWLLQLL